MLKSLELIFFSLKSEKIGELKFPEVGDNKNSKNRLLGKCFEIFFLREESSMMFGGGWSLSSDKDRFCLALH